LSGGWVGKIKIVPNDLGPVRKFNIQLKLSNPVLSPNTSIHAHTYDVEVNIAPEGKPLVRSNFSNQTIRTYTYKDVGYNYIYRFSGFNFVRKGFKNIGLLEGCERNLDFEDVNLSTSSPWKGEASCRGIEKKTILKGEITLQRGQFDESASASNVSSGGQSDRAVSSQQQGNQIMPPNRSVIDDVKNEVPAFLRNIFK
jgi:hypothetical protein